MPWLRECQKCIWDCFSLALQITFYQKQTTEFFRLGLNWKPCTCIWVLQWRISGSILGSESWQLENYEMCYNGNSSQISNSKFPLNYKFYFFHHGRTWRLHTFRGFFDRKVIYFALWVRFSTVRNSSEVFDIDLYRFSQSFLPGSTGLISSIKGPNSIFSYRKLLPRNDLLSS